MGRGASGATSQLIHRLQRRRGDSPQESPSTPDELRRFLAPISAVDLHGCSDGVLDQLVARLRRTEQLLAVIGEPAEEEVCLAEFEKAIPLIEAIMQMDEEIVEAELARMIDELAEAEDLLPVRTIEEIREHRELMIPRLIEVLSRAVAEVRAAEAEAAARGGEDRRRQAEVVAGNAHFFAVFLLTEFRAEEAFPALLEAFSLPEPWLFDLFGDAVFHFARVLAAFAADRPELVDALVADRGLNEYVRWQAAEYYLLMVRDGRLTREEGVERMRRQLARGIAEEDQELVGGLIASMVSLAPAEASAEIEEAFRLGLVDEGIISRSLVEAFIAGGEETVRRELGRYGESGVPDTIAELRRWASFSGEAEKAFPKPAWRQPRSLPSPGGAWEAVGIRVGRNDPCPCGSGKKFKKCCGSRI